ncbi:MAG: hypothetical protein M1825_000091 [Sarcosagium campestre]|nr:MAG: hypothetical protein M1825_000091 [Sarcosagium campestre]
MHFSHSLACVAGLLPATLVAGAAAPLSEAAVEARDYTFTTSAPSSKVTPKVVLIAMFDPEAEAFYGIPEFNVLERNITIPGASPLFPDVHCTSNGDVCQIIVGEGQGNAAPSILALTLSDKFDLRNTYFMVAGIAGISPNRGTLGTLGFAKYAIQVTNQYEIDAREIPDNFTGGYLGYGTDFPGEYPGNTYGTEVFEINGALQELAISFASTAKLNDSATAKAYRANYKGYSNALQAPSVIKCDIATSETFWHGEKLAAGFENTTKVWTNGSATYCTTASEDNSTLEALMRAAIAKLVDFERIIIMRAASNFDRQYPSQTAAQSLLFSNSGGFAIANKNLYLGGVKIVQGIIKEWDSKFKKGIASPNYVGDLLGSLGGTPDFGLNNYPEPQKKKRDLAALRSKMMKYRM